MSGWLQNSMIPLSPMMPQQQLPHPHAIPKLPMIPLSPHHPLLPFAPPQANPLNPTYLTNPESQYPTNTQPIELPKPDILNKPGQPLFPIQPQPPLVEERQHEPWQPLSKTKQNQEEELVRTTCMYSGLGVNSGCDQFYILGGGKQTGRHRGAHAGWQRVE